MYTEIHVELVRLQFACIFHEHTKKSCGKQMIHASQPGREQPDNLHDDEKTLKLFTFCMLSHTEKKINVCLASMAVVAAATFTRLLG